MRIILNKTRLNFMKKLIAVAVLTLASVHVLAAAEEFTLTIKNHVFEPKELKLPAGKKIKLLVVNQDATPAEFESKSLQREKVIPGKSTGIVNLGPLKAGRYDFVEEFHETQAGAQGTIVVE